ncbi:MAG: glycine C-acetyltransferase [Agarilytica sp.]
MTSSLCNALDTQLSELRQAGLFKQEHALSTAQRAKVMTNEGELLNLCSNNYLGLADAKDLVEEAKNALDSFGFGMASVRFICGTQTPHKQLESRLSKFLLKEDAILYSSCFDANAGIFECLFDERDAVISDALNHASIIDGIRLSKAKRLRYANNDMTELEKQLQAAKGSRFRLIVTDGVFSMDGILANLPGICDLAEKYDASVMVDDSHAVGVLGERGAGTAEYYGVEDRIDILSGTFGKALGGASGGYVAAKRPIVEWLRQRSRPYLFSNALAPAITAASIKAIELAEQGKELRKNLSENALYFRSRLKQAGFTLCGEGHPIVPVLVGDAPLAKEFSQKLFEKGIYAIAFSYPVVPKGKSRIRTQISAGHSRADIEFAINAFVEVGRLLKLI